ncbi:tetratricopeptide (TPR) repeat protein [Flavobacterium nitrogenifigens]|uniref:Tetratricopeptide (TPR) repeat protein n=3 Tax=Flavobacteriaceae TaxID=49546 RepID=A0A7W7IWT2_9FLAO|nr:tetratricopeptide (TPR) repeat protein [Flavobacterium nitrogenifigens]MBB6386895.1 tetratricopeptide (TPR) repeat protein [Flavobacterium notoginsengisoli]
MGLALDSIKVFPIPSSKANELFGCLVFNKNKISLTDIDKNNCCQLVENKLFIPEYTTIEPQLTKEEWTKLFSECYHFLHPDIGLVELDEEVNWNDLVEVSEERSINILEPSKTVSIPQFISSFRLEVDAEKILENIENPYSEEEMIENLPFNIQKLLNGNQKEMDKFLAFLEKKPEVALKMAIPLDTLGTGRGGAYGKFYFGSNGGSFGQGIGGIIGNLSSSASGVLRWIFVLIFVSVIRGCSFNSNSFGDYPFFTVLIILFVVVFIVALALQGSSSRSISRSGSSALLDSQRFNTLQDRYEKLAEKYIEQKEYSKAAHIYIKLLKNYNKAAGVLENGEMYNEAAAIYLKYLNNKAKAAECYEKGHAYRQAIEIYKELNQDEKTGDLYLILKEKKEADKYFQKVIDRYKANFQYVKASLIYKNKIGNISEAQVLLREGWRTNKDAYNCLNNYFSNIKTTDELAETISEVYGKDVSETNSESFLQAIKQEFKRDQKMEELTKNIAYEIVANKIDKKPEIALELLHFNEKNRSMLKDVMKYKIKAGKKA